MNSRIWCPPAPPLRGRVVRAALAGLTVVAAASALVGTSIDGARFVPFVAPALFAAIMAVAVGASGHHPFPRFGSANVVTMTRAMLAALLAAALTGYGSAPMAWTIVALAASAAVLDGIDGWLARRTKMASPFGARFDMEVDALLILILSVLAWRLEKAGAWVLGSGLMRYAFVACGWMLPWMAAPLRPTLRGRAVAISQVVVLAVALAPVVPPSLSRMFAAAGLAALTWSFAVDVRFLWARRHDRPEAPRWAQSAGVPKA